MKPADVRSSTNTSIGLKQTGFLDTVLASEKQSRIGFAEDNHCTQW